MPVRYEVEQATGTLIVERTGTTSAKEEEDSFRARKTDPRVVSGMPVLVDNSGVEPADSVQTIRFVAEVVGRNASRLHCGPTALVVGSDVMFGMARMLVALVEPHHPDMAIFRSREDAAAWLHQRVNQRDTG